MQGFLSLSNDWCDMFRWVRSCCHAKFADIFVKDLVLIMSEVDMLVLTELSAVLGI